MKRIIAECSQQFYSGKFADETVKLRLRGKGSNFKEGPERMESQDPLNLCVSSKDPLKYNYACDEV